MATYSHNLEFRPIAPELTAAGSHLYSASDMTANLVKKPTPLFPDYFL